MVVFGWWWCWGETNGAAMAGQRCILLLGGSASKMLLRALPVVRLMWWILEGAEWRRCGCCILGREMNGPQALHPRGDEWRLVFGCILPVGEEWRRSGGCILRSVGTVVGWAEAC